MSEREDILKFAEHGLVVSSHGFERIIEKNLDVEEVIESARENNIWLITDEFLDEFIKKDEEITEVVEEITSPEKEKPKIEVVRTKHVYAEEIESQLHIFENTDVTGKSTCDGTIENFVDYFNQRYKTIREFLRDRPEYRASIPIEALKKNNINETMRIICMVTSKRESSRGYRFLEVEDPTGNLTVLIPKDNQHIINSYDSILLDEVVGIEGVMRNKLFIANNIVEPDIPLDKSMNTSSEPVYLALLSDIHVGSYLFLEKEFYRFLDWLNGKGDNKEVAEKIKYILVAGDLVDGIGIYPSQEKELTIPDIYKQYDFLSKLLENIPDYIEIVLGMGNHDAVRKAEPQPRLDKDIGAPLYELPNVHMVGSPVMISTHGVKTLMYHGTSLDTIIGHLSDCTYTAPEHAMTQYIVRRNLVPMYGSDGIAPEEKDYLMIGDVPDILHCGHVHTNGYASYRGVRVINSGTWQGKTRYQEQLGHQPTPARVPVINLQNHEVSIIPFSG